MGHLADKLVASLQAGQIALPLALALVGGLLTALSPCIYPLVPITLSIMGARSYESHLHGFLVASSYVLGMALIYTALGVLFALSGMLLGSLMQNSFVLLMLALLFLLFALSMFGVFPLILPTHLVTSLSRIGGNGFKGAFLMGLVAGLIAAPCTGPVLGFILGIIAEKQDIKLGLWLMFAFSCGLGLPFLILGTFSSALALIPKSGRWMNGIKIILGLAMLSTAFYYAYLALPKPSSTVKINAWHSINAQNHESDFNRLLEQAQAEKKPVLIDFYADWCVACHELDEITYKDPKLIERLKHFFLIKIDASNDAPHLSKILQRFGINGLPTTLIIATKNPNEPIRILGFVSAQALLSALNSVQTD